MKVTLVELRQAAKDAFGERASVWDATDATETVVATGDGYQIRVSGKSQMGARRNALGILERLGPAACEVCKDVLEPAPARCEKHAHGDVSDYEVEP